MPQTFLHIQAEDSPATRVLELAGTSVRIGRGVQCEVRLNEPALAEVQCMLRRRADTWYVLPVGPPGRIALDGGPVNMQQPLPVGAALQVGNHRLALQSPEPTPEELGSFSSPIPVEAIADPETVAVSRPIARADDGLAAGSAVAPDQAPSQAGLEAERHRLERWQTRLEQRERWLKTRQDEQKWESRWKAVGARVRARSVASPPAPDPLPAPPPRPAVPPQPPVEGRRATWSAAPAPVWADAPSVKRIVPSARTAVIAEPPPPPPAPEPPPRPAAPEPVGPDLSRTTTPGPPRVEPQPLQAPVPEPVSPDWRVLKPEPAVPAPRSTGPAPRLMPGPAPERPRRPRQSPPPFRGEPLARADRASAAPHHPIAPPLNRTVTAHATPKGRVAHSTNRAAPHLGSDVPRPASPPAVTPETVVLRPPPAESTPAPLERLPEGPEWPTAAAIFAACPRRNPASAPRRATAQPRLARPAPTVQIAPDQWSLPFWPAWAVSAAMALAAGLMGLLLAWCWGFDDAAAGRVADRVFALTPSGPSTAQAARRPPDPQDAPAASWWRSTSAHFFTWALAQRRAESDAEEVAAFLQAARGASPWQAASLFAEDQIHAGQNPREGLAASLGLSQDIVSLTWAAHRLRLAGKAETALRRYAAALDLAARSQLADQPAPVFDTDPDNSRFRLPYEALIAPIVREMAEEKGWTFSQWSQTLPAFAVAPLVAGRELRALGRTAESDQAFDLAIAQARQPAEPGASAAVHLAAGAEALALRQRWREAEDLYQSAVDQMPNDRIRRTWWLNLAEIYQALNDESKRLAAWESARGNDPNDEISKRVVAAMTRAGVAPAPVVKKGRTKTPFDREPERTRESTTETSDPGRRP